MKITVTEEDIAIARDVKCRTLSASGEPLVLLMAEAAAKSRAGEREACEKAAREVQREHEAQGARAVGSAARGIAGCQASIAERIADAIHARGDAP